MKDIDAITQEASEVFKKGMYEDAVNVFQKAANLIS